MASKAKKKSGSTAAKVFKIIGLSLLAMLLLVAIFFIIYFASNGFGGSYATFITKINGKTVLSNQTVSLPSGSTINVYSFSDYTISVNAAKGSDFVFIVDGDEYSFADYADDDMTAGFELTEDGGTVTITYGTAEEILSEVFDADVTVSEEVEGEIFELVVESGNSSLHLPFSLEYIVNGGIQVEPDRIVF